MGGSIQTQAGTDYFINKNNWSLKFFSPRAIYTTHDVICTDNQITVKTYTKNVNITEKIYYRII